jgi:Ca-activated chloride channel family protein
MSLDAFTLLRPWWLLAPPVILALAILARSRGALGDWRRAVDAPLLAVLAARGAVVSASRRALGLSAWLVAAALIGLAGAVSARRRKA